MNLLSYLIRKFTPSVQKSASDEVAVSALSPEALAWLSGSSDPSHRAGATLVNAYEQVVWVYRAINALAEQVANIPFLFSAGDRGRENLITTGPLADFYAHPHPQINRFQYWELRIIWLMLRGECFRVPIYDDGATAAFRSRGAKIKKVLILDPSRFQHIIRDNQLEGWRYTGTGPNTPLESQIFLPEEVWFEKLPNPFDFWHGSAQRRQPRHPNRLCFRCVYAWLHRQQRRPGRHRSHGAASSPLSSKPKSKLHSITVNAAPAPQTAPSSSGESMKS